MAMPYSAIGRSRKIRQSECWRASRKFISVSESDIAAALGDDLDAMHREINCHLELGVIAVEKLLRHNPRRSCQLTLEPKGRIVLPPTPVRGRA
jgi:hypothetical protein